MESEMKRVEGEKEGETIEDRGETRDTEREKERERDSETEIKTLSGNNTENSNKVFKIAFSLWKTANDCFWLDLKCYQGYAFHHFAKKNAERFYLFNISLLLKLVYTDESMNRK